MEHSERSSPGTESTRDLAAWDRMYVWHPFTPMKPWCERQDLVVIQRGEREFLIDTEGRRYIDGVSSLWCNVHGHCVPELDAAVRQQLSRIAHSTLLGLANVPSILLAKRLIELAQACGLKLSKVFYSDDGSTAVEVACKMAYQYWRNVEQHDPPDKPAGWRGRFLALREAYHGDTVGAVSLGGIPLFHDAFRGLCFPVDFAPPPARTDGGAATLARMEELLHQSADTYAAIIIEPLIQGAGGMIVHPPGFLRRVRELADRYRTLLIADEVMTGFGRTGTMFACQQEGITPDVLCLSKGITGGYMPLGATLTTREVFDAFYANPREGKTLYHGHTFTGHPLACAAAIASLELFEKNGVLEHVQRLVPLLEQTLETARRRPFVADVRRCGLIGAIELRQANGQPFPMHWRVGGELCLRMRALGLMMRPLGDIIVLMPPLAIRAENLRRLCDGVLEALIWLPEIVRAKTGEIA